MHGIVDNSMYVATYIIAYTFAGSVLQIPLMLKPFFVLCHMYTVLEQTKMYMHGATICLHVVDEGWNYLLII